MTTLLPLLFLKLKLLIFAGNDGTSYYLKFNGLFSSGTDHAVNLIRQVLPVPILTLLIPVLSLISIFLFRNRKLQMKLALLVILLSAILILAGIIYSLLIIKEFKVQIIPGFMMIVPVLVLIFSILAWMGIKKDENLVRSYDRLR